ncbi:MAG: DUF4493 domain-containing protein [Bacteroidales bacterium]|nr:DUF4493 domain-containing protein [Bacteroidales bacterium]
MKNILMTAALIALPLLSTSCSWLYPESEESLRLGTITVLFEEGTLPSVKAQASANEPAADGTCTKSSNDEIIPDVSDFLLEVTSSDGKSVYNGKYGASPEHLSVEAGSYSVKVLSTTFKSPAFSAPLYGDEQIVVVKAGQNVDVRMSCSLKNCGVRIRTDASFLTSCPNSTIHVKSSEGSLMYGYSERRVAYFNPGRISVVMSGGSGDKVLLTRELSARDILDLGLSASSQSTTSQSASPSIKVAVDTSRNWLGENYEIGGSSKGGDISDAYTIAQARDNTDAEDVWVAGYIVGGDLTSSTNGISFQAPFTSATNIALADRSTASAKSSCLSVQLPSGSVRDALNLRDNPSLLGRKVYIKGDLVEAYYGIPGIKNITEYKFK